MKTYFSKAEQKWVSEIPVAYWLGVYDERTGEKIYSDESLYYDMGVYGKQYQCPFPIENAQNYYNSFGYLPGVCQSHHYRKGDAKPKWPKWRFLKYVFK